MASTSSNAENEWLRAHRKLDREGVPRNDDHGQPLSLALRIAVLIDKLTEESHVAPR